MTKSKSKEEKVCFTSQVTVHHKGESKKNKAGTQRQGLKAELIEECCLPVCSLWAPFLYNPEHSTRGSHRMAHQPLIKKIPIGLPAG